VKAIAGFARWWALSLIATGLDLYDLIPRRTILTAAEDPWTDGSDD
jgi:hypothetical protein